MDSRRRTNSPDGAHEFTPLHLGRNAVATRTPPRLIFRGDDAPAVVFVGNPANTNAAVISADSVEMAGRMEITGNKVFDIGDGPAPVDLRIEADFMNGQTNAAAWPYAGIDYPAALVKTGAGTLEIAGNARHTLGTLVEEGELRVSGSVSGALEVHAGAALSGSGIVSGAVSFAESTAFRATIHDETRADVLTVLGGVQAEAPVQVLLPDELPDGGEPGEWLIMQAGAGATLGAAYAADHPKYTVASRNGATQLWVIQRSGSLLILR